jgi:beta-xylosidase
MKLMRAFPMLGTLLALSYQCLESRAAEPDEMLVLAFFRDNGQAGIYLAASEDGLRFTALHKDQPVMKPAPWHDQQLTRDPSIVFHDGKFHAVWTSNWKGRCFGYAESTDLRHWSEPVRVQPFPESLPPADQPRNVWAPEICWDPVQTNYAIVWSSTTERESRNGDGSSMDGKDGSWDHRLFVSRTADGKIFSKAKLFFDPKFCCIDGMLAFDASVSGGRWALVFKHEQEQGLGGKNLRLVFAPADFSQPWSPVGGPLAGPGSSVRPTEMAEGPSLMKWHGTWYLYWDAFANGHYSLATSPNLRDWTDRTAELQLPPHPRHGTVFCAPRNIVQALKE